MIIEVIRQQLKIQPFKSLHFCTCERTLQKICDKFVFEQIDGNRHTLHLSYLIYMFFFCREYSLPLYNCTHNSLKIFDEIALRQIMIAQHVFRFDLEYHLSCLELTLGCQISTIGRHLNKLESILPHFIIHNVQQTIEIIIDSICTSLHNFKAIERLHPFEFRVICYRSRRVHKQVICFLLLHTIQTHPLNHHLQLFLLTHHLSSHLIAHRCSDMKDILEQVVDFFDRIDYEHLIIHIKIRFIAFYQVL